MGSNSPPLVLYGASGHAASVPTATPALWEPDPLFRVVAYIDDFRGDGGATLDGAPVISFATWRRSFAAAAIFIAVASPPARRTLAARVAAAGGRFASLFRLGGTVAPDVVVGEGSALMVDATVGAATVVGRHVQVMPLVTIDRGCAVGDYVTICPLATLSGRIVLEEAVFVGAGARIVNAAAEPLRIGSGAIIGAGADVRRSVHPGEKLAGDPAQDLRSVARAARRR